MNSWIRDSVLEEKWEMSQHLSSMETNINRFITDENNILMIYFLLRTFPSCSTKQENTTWLIKVGLINLPWLDRNYSREEMMLTVTFSLLLPSLPPHYSTTLTLRKSCESLGFLICEADRDIQPTGF